MNVIKVINNNNKQ